MVFLISGYFSRDEQAVIFVVNMSSVKVVSNFSVELSGSDSEGFCG